MIQYLTIMLNAKRDEQGASAVEYGLLVAGIAALIVAAVFAFGGLVDGIFESTSGSIETGRTAGGTGS